MPRKPRNDDDDFFDDDFESTIEGPPTTRKQKKELPTAVPLPAPSVKFREKNLEDYRRDFMKKKDLKKSKANVREDEDDEDSEFDSDDSAPGYYIEEYVDQLKLKAEIAKKNAEEATNEANKSKKQVYNERHDARKSQGMTTERNITSINTARDQIKKAHNMAKEAEDLKTQAQEWQNYMNSRPFIDAPLASPRIASKTKKKPTFFSRFKNMFTRRNSNVKVGGKGSQKKRRKNKHKK
jgi:hypothetical protein